jgi:hypothetical protein
MEKSDKRLFTTCGILALIGLLLVVATASVGLWFFHKTEEAMPQVKVTDTTNVIVTPAQVKSIRDIGQWEFLSVSTEELADTIRRGFFTDDHLVRIYYGTLRLGIDFATVGSECFSASGDTLIVNLPDIKLLDEDFIDEARTYSFYESGQWSGRDRDNLYQRARRRMINRTLTEENIRSARQQAESQVVRLLHIMGFENVSVSFQQQ